MTKNGIHIKPNGPAGFLYVVENGKLAEVEYELIQSGAALYFSRTTSWVLPVKQLMTPEERINLKNNIMEWSGKTNNPVEFDD